MKAREIPSRLKTRVAPRVNTVLRAPPVQRAAERILGVLDRVTEAADRAEVIKAVQQRLKDRGADQLVARPLAAVRRELDKVAHPTNGAADHPMPEMIKSTGGKRVPANVARRAVKRSGDEFKPKKGKR